MCSPKNANFEKYLLNAPIRNSVVLITSFYECLNMDKYKEWIHCIEKNTQDDSINKIVLFIEGFPYINDTSDLTTYFNINSSKIELVKINCRPNFYDLIDYANKHYKDQIVTISNCDIYFENLGVVTNINMNKVIFMLSRYSFCEDKTDYYLPTYQTGNFFPSLPYSLSCVKHMNNYNNSYHPKYKYVYNRLTWGMPENCDANSYTSDAWIFKTPMTLKDSYKDVRMGEYRCDNKLSKLFIDKVLTEGYTFENPCLTIKAIHYDFNRKRDNYCREEEWFEDVDHHTLFVNWSYISDNFN
jgi:hypothetical protein